MAHHDDFWDDYIDYLIIEESMKGEGGGKTPKPNTESCGCSTWAVIAFIVIIVLYLFGSCGNSSSKSYSSGSYRNTYSASSYTSSSRSSYSGSSSYGSSSSSKPVYSSSRSYTGSSPKHKSSSSDPYNAKSYYDAEDFYYDNYDDFWDYEDAEDYYNEHCDD